MRELAIIMHEIGSLRRIYGNYTVIHENIRTLRLILCVSIAILGGNKTQMRETHAQCVRVGRSGFIQQHLLEWTSAKGDNGEEVETIAYTSA